MKLTDTEKMEIVNDLTRLKEAILGYGNDLTKYQSFQTLMIEEKINILATAVVALLSLKIKENE